MIYLINFPILQDQYSIQTRGGSINTKNTNDCLQNIVQSMSRKGTCMDNGAMENFFVRLKVEMYYGEKFESVKHFIQELEEYIDYYNNDRISLKLKGMSPVQYRTHLQES